MYSKASGTIYVTECWRCDEEIAHVRKNSSNRTFCENCEEKYFAEKEEKLERYVELKVDLMFERALRNMEKQEMPMHEYKEASEVVHEFARKDSTKFDSTPEMMAAIELLKNEVPIKAQYKMKRHRIDILIPSMKVALEIDGYMHKYQVLKDSVRDVDLVEEFGVGWEVVRIPTKHIEQKLSRLIPAIKAIYNEKQKLRRKNGGFIPVSFSKRDKELQEMIEQQSR